MRNILKLFSFLTAISFAPCIAQATPQDTEGWFSTTALVSLDDEKKYQLYLEGQSRIGDNWERMATVILRPAAVYNFTPALSAYAGYAWAPSFYTSNYYRDYRDEQRFWQQILYKHNFAGLSWQHRLRQEQRKIARTDGVSNRTRYLLRGSYALNEAKDFGITGYDEFMVNWNSVDGGPWSGYDRNRIFAGPYWQRKNVRYEVGYLGEHAKRFGSDPRWVNALAALASFSF